MKLMSSIANPKNGKPAGMIAKDVYDIVMANAEMLDSAVIYNRDFHYNLCVSIFTCVKSSLILRLALDSRLLNDHTCSESMDALLRDPST